MPTALQKQWHDERQERLARIAARAIRPAPMPKPKPAPAPVDNCLSEAEKLPKPPEIPSQLTETALWALVAEARALAGEQPPEPPSLRCIIQATALFYGLREAELLAPCRQMWAVRPRHVAMYLCRHITARSWGQIGRAIGGRDHTSVMHGYRKIEWQLKRDDKLRAVVAVLKARLGADGEM
jgi:hypothetical protein